MKYLLLSATLGLSAALTTPVSAQSTSATAVAPRTPGGVSAGTTPADQPRMDRTVSQTSQKLLNEERDRPLLPGQAPTPSQGGTAARTTSPRQGMTIR